MISKDTIRDLTVARDILSKHDYSIVIVKNNEVIGKRKGQGIKPVIELIDGLDKELENAVIGDRILGKAAALLCRYVNAKAVYSPKGTKTALALLIIAGIPSQVDQIISHVKNREGSNMCPFEKILKNVDSPEEAFKILKRKVC